MIPRYAIPIVSTICSLPAKYVRWLKVEIAIIQARINLELIPKDKGELLIAQLQEHPIDANWIDEREITIKHDLNAFLEERLRFVDLELQQYFHQGATSYDTEEPALSNMLINVGNLIIHECVPLKESLLAKAYRYRYTPMLGRTHGQEAKIQSFGKRFADYVFNFNKIMTEFDEVLKSLEYSKISGAIGNYSSIDPEVEQEALRILGLKPFIGATQILPRTIHGELAKKIQSLACLIEQIALDVRLGARSGLPICRENFGKGQKGSSAMPHKRNTILAEQLCGIKRLIDAYVNALVGNSTTWEERSIDQSCVERVAWEDLFHSIIYSIQKATALTTGLVVLPDNMMKEIINSRGCYASDEVKDFAKKYGSEYELDAEDSYRLVQLASFNVHEPIGFWKDLRETEITSLQHAQNLLMEAMQQPVEIPQSIQKVLVNGALKVSDELEATEEQVSQWNDVLKKIFASEEKVEEFNTLFSIPQILRNEHYIFDNLMA